jgi:hypothetical protein
VVGCDNILGSTAKKDRCGVCKGNGSSCTDNTITKVFNQSPDQDGCKENMINIGKTLISDYPWSYLTRELMVVAYHGFHHDTIRNFVKYSLLMKPPVSDHPWSYLTQELRVVAYHRFHHDTILRNFVKYSLLMKPPVSDHPWSYLRHVLNGRALTRDHKGLELYGFF